MSEPAQAEDEPLGEDEAVEQLVGITGLPEQEARGFLEMAGGSVEAAMGLYFSMAGAEGDADFGEPVGAADEAASMDWELPVWHGLVWPAGALPAAWVEQGFAFSGFAHDRLGIPQPMNGPCGVLAALHGRVVAQEILAQRAAAAADVAAPGFGPGWEVTDAALARALGAVLVDCAGAGGEVQLAAWVGPVGKAVTTSALPAAEVAAAVEEQIESFKDRGGCLLLVYSAVLSRGEAAVRAPQGVIDRPIVLQAGEATEGSENDRAAGGHRRDRHHDLRRGLLPRLAAVALHRA
jgi:hypothetical protein